MMSIQRWMCPAILAVALTTSGSPASPEAHAPSPEEPLQQGQVVDACHKPIAGAKVYWFARGLAEKTVDGPVATTDAEGQFRFHAAVPDAPEDPEDFRFPGPEAPGLMATADGFGLGFSPAHPRGRTRVVLVKDDVPMTGRILDDQGKPIVGARVRGTMLLAPADDDLSAEDAWPKTWGTPATLDPWLNALKAAEDSSSRRQVGRLLAPIPGRRGDIFPAIHPPAVTGADGRFRIDGIGPDRVLMAIIEGAGIESRVVFLATKAVEKPGIEPIWRQPAQQGDRDHSDLVYGPGFDHVAKPGRAVEGVVRDKDTGRPMPGVQVGVGRQTDLERRLTRDARRISRVMVDDVGYFRTTTDAAGRYKIEGLPVGPPQILTSRTGQDRPYPPLSKIALIGPGAGPIPLDFSLKRGVWLTGRVMDRATGDPYDHAHVKAHLDESNPNLPERPDQSRFEDIWTEEDGRFRIASLPGPGYLTASGSDEHLKGVGADQIKPEKQREEPFPPPRYRPSINPDHVNTIVAVDPPDGSGPIAVDLFLERGGSRLVKVVGPDGRPATGLSVSVISISDVIPLEDSEFTLPGLGPKGREIVIRQDAEKRIARVVVTEAEGPITVKLEPWGTLSGRVLEPDDQPGRGELSLRWKGEGAPFEKKPVPPTFSDRALDAEGRFSIEGLVPGAAYSLNFTGKQEYLSTPVAQEVFVKPGEARDVGDLRVRRRP